MLTWPVRNLDVPFRMIMHFLTDDHAFSSRWSCFPPRWSWFFTFVFTFVFCIRFFTFVFLDSFCLDSFFSFVFTYIRFLNSFFTFVLHSFLHSFPEDYAFHSRWSWPLQMTTLSLFLLPEIIEIICEKPRIYLIHLGEAQIFF